MANSLVKALPMLLSMMISQFIYLKIDSKYNVTTKINSRLSIRHEYKAFFCICSVLISILIIGVIGIYVIDITDTLYGIISGILAGIGIQISLKLSKKQTL
jgi:hypothetical protein